MRHDKAQAELDQMYEAIFSGPTPDVPGEDDLEQAVKNTRDWLQQCEMFAGDEKQALQTLDKAKDWLKTALSNMENAHGHSQMNMFGGGMMSDSMERDSLSKAQNNLTQCLRSMDEARRLQPAVPGLREVSIDQGHMISDRIKDSQAQMQNAMKHLESIRSEQQQRLRDAKSQVRQASNQLEDAKKELQQARSEAFDRSDNQGKVNGEAPPAYGA